MGKKARMNRKPNLAKARLLFPFAKRYRTRLRLASEPEALRIISSHIIVTDDHKFAFVKNSKAGCTTVAHALYYYNFEKKYSGRIHGGGAGLIQGPDFASVGVQALTNKNTYKFTFVRNPTTRVISAFHNFILEQTNRSARQHLRHMPEFGYRVNSNQSEKFDAFINYIEYCFSKNKAYTDPHFRLQTINTAHGTVSYDHVAKIENYSEEIRFIFQAAGMWTEHYKNAFHIKANTSRTAQYIPTPEQLDRIEQLYGEDYDAYDYSRPSDNMKSP